MSAPEEPVGELVQPPFLSIVLTGRNDGYGGDFNERFLRTLGFNHAQLATRGIAHEYVFVEWAPPADTPSLRELVREALPDLPGDVLRWYAVDRRYQEALSLDPHLRYLEFVAKNVGIRRARGAYILATNCDIYLGRHVLGVLERGALEPRLIYRAPRYDLKLALDQTHLDWNVLEDPRNLDGPERRLKPPFMPGGTGDFLLADRDTFHELRGFNEIYRLVRAGIDRNFVVKALSSGLSLTDIGGPVYHVSHVGSYRARHLSAHANAASTSAKERWHANGVSYDNPEGWGLGDAPERAVGERCWVLEFSEAALPPLVDLRAIVLPIARQSGPRPGRYEAGPSHGDHVGHG